MGPGVGLGTVVGVSVAPAVATTEGDGRAEGGDSAGASAISVGDDVAEGGGLPMRHDITKAAVATTATKARARTIPPAVIPAAG